MKFRNVYEKMAVNSAIGSKKEPIYSAYYDENGVIQLEQVGERNVYEEIQSYADSVDIENIIRRFNQGEVDVLSKVQGFYDDVSEMPKNYQDVLNTVLKSEQFFDSLPIEEKAKFNNSFSQFIVSIGAPDFMARFGSDTEPMQPIDNVKIEEEGTDNES